MTRVLMAPRSGDGHIVDHLSGMIERGFRGLDTLMINGSRKPILVTGAHRSGTTWVGQMLAQDRRVRYVAEPFRTSLQPCSCGVQFTCWFQYICEDNAGLYRDHIRHVIGLSHDPIADLRSARSLRQALGVSRRYASFLRDRLTLRPLVKDPIAVLSAEWLAAAFGMDVVVLVRHPAAFASSIKAFGWSHPFSQFLEQPLLLRDHFGPFEQEIRQFAHREHDVIDQAALLWRLIYSVVRQYRESHEDWIFLRHEDVARNPTRCFKRLYQRLNLDFTDQVLSAVRAHSNAHNPAEPGDPYSIRRDSRATAQVWKQRLSESEVERVWTQVRTLSSEFYSAEEW